MKHDNPMAWTAVLVYACSGCMTDGSVDANRAPVAEAGEDQELAYDGSPVEVRLDGRSSRDPDGRVEMYRWLSGNLEQGDAAMGRRGPDPDDEPRPTVALEQGLWSFVLWVRDDDGSISEPDVVQIIVGEVDSPACDPDECPTPPLGAACCTTSDTGEEPGDARGRAPDLCGTDLAAVVPSLAGVCLQTDQPGEASSECPEIMGATLEPGCCTDEGLCGSLNTSAGLGCHYPQEGPGEECTP